MAITITEFTLPISPEQARDFLQHETDSFGVFFDAERCYELMAKMQFDNAKILTECKRLSKNVQLNLSKKDVVIDTLINMGVSSADFVNLRAATDKRALNDKVQQSILENNSYSPEIHKFVQRYKEYSTNNVNIARLNTYTLYPTCVALSKLNRRMTISHPTWELLSTSRISAKDPGVQGISRTTPDIITEPKGYTLLRCDSSQIEPRINFSTYLRDELIMKLIMYYGDAYFGLLHYCEMTDEELHKCQADFEHNFKPLDITDEIKSSRQNIKRLTNAGSYGSMNLDGINPKLARVYQERIVKHPKRLALQTQVTHAVEQGVTTFYGQFGTPVTPDSTARYDKGSSGWKEHLIRCGINNPVQTTASELMIHSISEARKILLEAKDSHVCFYKHDEACFYISDDDMADGVGEKLKDITAYNVKDWIPIPAEAEWGIKKGAYPSVLK